MRNLHAILMRGLSFLLLSVLSLITFAQNSYLDGPIQLTVKVREVETRFNNTDLALAFGDDEMTYKVWCLQDGGGAPNPVGWQGGACLTDEFQPPGVSRDFNYTMANYNFTSLTVPRFIDIIFEGYENDEASVCVENRCDYELNIFCPFGINEDDDNHCFGIPFKDNLDYRNGNPCETFAHGGLIADPGVCGNNDWYRPRVETFWRYTRGTACTPTAAIDLFSFSSGSAVTHFNSNVCYSNNFSSSPGNDVFYTFNTTAPIGAEITLCGSVSWDTEMYLLDANCNIISSNDNASGCGLASQINYPLCDVGRYYIVVDGAAAGEQGTFSLVITEDTNILLDYNTSSTPVTCAGSSDGTASVSIVSGTGPFTYSWSPGTFGNVSSISNLPAGNYTVDVTDNFGCTITKTITVATPAPIVLDTTLVQNPSCVGINDGIVQLSVTGGTQPYQYSVDFGNTFQNNSSFGNLGAGIYDFIVRDINGCSDTIFNVQLFNPPPNIFSNAVITDVSCNGGADGSASFAPYGGQPPYTYSFNGGPTTSTTTYTNLAPGNYNIRIRDAVGCTLDTMFNIVQPVVLTSLVTASTNVTCNGLSDGEFTVAASGGTPPYRYSIDNVIFQSSGTFSSLAAGTYTINVLDTNNCTSSNVVTITEPTPLVVAELFHLDPTCNGSTDGVAVIAASGGTGPYQYSDDNVTYQNNAAFDNLADGSYWFYAQDFNGCIDSVLVLIDDPTALAATATTTDATCSGVADGEIVVNATGGTAPYTYSLDGGVFQSDSTFSNLAGGSYIVTVRDVNFCELTVPFTVADAATITASFSAVTNVACFGDATGAFTVLGSGGAAPYQYGLNGGALGNSGVFTGLTAGTYPVTIVDDNGCQLDTSITITEPQELVVSLSITNASCYNTADGSIDLTVTGGTPGYTYTWSGGLPANQDQQNLNGGTYMVTVEDANGCTEMLTIVVDQSPEVFISVANVTDVTCAGAADGGIDITISGGAPPFTYSWDNGSGSEDLTNVNGGTYGVTVTDVNGCSITTSATVGEENVLTVTVSGAGTVTCAGGGDGVITATAAGGVAPYEYALNGGVFQAGPTFTGLVPGSYFVRVRDANLCEVSSGSVVVDDAIETTLTYEDVLITEGESGQLVPDLDPADIEIDSIIWNPVTDLSCVDCLDPVASPEDTTEYTVTIVDTNGCRTTATVMVFVDDNFRAFIPNVFSPNGDGQNDSFSFYSFGAVETRVRIYNRWGSLLYENPNQPSAAPGWDGMYKDKEAPEGTYVYVIDILFNNGVETQYTGSVTLLR